MAPKKDKAPPPSSKPAKSGGGKQKKKKWSKGKQKEKVNNMVLFDKATYDKLLSEAPKYKLITPDRLRPRTQIDLDLALKQFETKSIEAVGLRFDFVGSRGSFDEGLGGHSEPRRGSPEVDVNGSLARKAIRELMARGLIRMVCLLIQASRFTPEQRTPRVSHSLSNFYRMVGNGHGEYITPHESTCNRTDIGMGQAGWGLGVYNPRWVYRVPTRHGFGMASRLGWGMENQTFPNMPDSEDLDLVLVLFDSSKIVAQW
ncbi:ribosomal protein S25 family protein [Actinidia rufa]|uniref:Ribosomal protein S25 family protein n=1 Tax=Actinidia rufa TaxID=165716 RepID=A0A7J0EUM4_9ERIC|nr:ribosomal protein S25 family protein [Actinidia rufa]